MQSQLATMFRHALTGLPAAGAALLALGWLMPDEAGQVDALQAQMAAGLAAVLGGIAGRLVLMGLGWLGRKAPWLGQAVRVIFGADDADGSSGGASALILVMGWGLAVAAAVPGLTGCAGGNDWRVSGSIGLVPMDGAKAGLRWENGTVSGFARGQVVDAETGEVVGTGEIRVDRGSGK